MDLVIVSVSYAERPAVELDLPTDLPAGQLAPQIARNLGLGASTAYALEVVASGHRLRPDETLAAAQVWDGERLRLVGLVLAPAPTMPALALPPAAGSAVAAPFHESHAAAPAAPAPAPVSAPAAGPARLPADMPWRPLDLPPAPETQPDNADGFVWKPLPDRHT